MKMPTLLLSVFALALSACGNTQQSNTQYTPIETQENVQDNSDEQWFAYGAITGVGDAIANGVGQSHWYKDGRFVHTISVNINIAPDGYFYEGWLVNGEEVISTGRLTNNFGDTRYALQFEADEDLTGYTKVIITLEKDDGNIAPDVRVAEGELHVREPQRS